VPRRYHHGMARQCPRGHYGTKPGEGVDGMSARHSTPPAPDLAKGKGRAAREEARGRHGRNPRRGRRWSREHKEPIDKISWTGRCTIAGSIECAPSRRLAPAGAVGIERGDSDNDSVARARERREGGGRRVDWPSRVDRATWSGSTRQAGADKWARPDRWGQEEF
jgi:hypothetical protein